MGELPGDFTTIPCEGKQQKPKNQKTEDRNQCGNPKIGIRLDNLLGFSASDLFLSASPALFFYLPFLSGTSGSGWALWGPGA
jgi:hypothetical protein